MLLPLIVLLLLLLREGGLLVKLEAVSPFEACVRPSSTSGLPLRNDDRFEAQQRAEDHALNACVGCVGLSLVLHEA